MGQTVSNIGSSFINGITALPRLAYESIAGGGIQREFGPLFTEEGAKNYGEFLGKAALFGLAAGGSIVAGALTGGAAFAATLPGLTASAIAFGGNIKDIIDSRDFRSDWNKTENQIMASEAGQALQALTLVSGVTGATKSIPQAIKNISTIANRARGVTSVGEIAKITVPAIKSGISAGGSIAQAANASASLISYMEGVPNPELGIPIPPPIPPSTITSSSRSLPSMSDQGQSAQTAVNLLRRPIQPETYIPRTLQQFY